MPQEALTLLRRHQDRLLVGLGIIVLFWLWHVGHLEWGQGKEVPEWMDARLLIFAGVAMAFAVLGLVRAALGIAFSYPLVVIVAEVLGKVAVDVQETFMGEDHDPIRPGVWLAVGLFVWVVVLSALGEWRARRWERFEAEQAAAAEPKRGATDAG